MMNLDEIKMLVKTTKNTRIEIRRLTSYGDPEREERSQDTSSIKNPEGNS